MVVMDSVIRLLHGVITQASHEDDSFSNGLLEYPQYTRPVEWRGKRVPDVLLSGHHENIATWRREQSLLRTKEKRPDLFSQVSFTKQDEKIMKKNIAFKDKM